MPYAVWLELPAPEPVSDAAAAEHLPDLIVELLKAGWDVPWCQASATRMLLPPSTRTKTPAPAFSICACWDARRDRGHQPVALCGRCALDA